ncbi:hypothetical protein CEXT_230161 [Caerostris extrusa]|uniref:Uncharacterized protein n=1 Tax=Caerostris extrusa TaxID=172846 RepID=A0AAV4Q5N1_CAEEX|nr:hypothetical protein CEXT_230161 [Caerostris extrusa]
MRWKMVNLENMSVFMLRWKLDRMIDMGFEEDVRTIFPILSAPEACNSKCRESRQPVQMLFQEGNMCEQEAKIVHLLETLSKTAPPVKAFIWYSNINFSTYSPVVIVLTVAIKQLGLIFHRIGITGRSGKKGNSHCVSSTNLRSMPTRRQQERHNPNDEYKALKIGKVHLVA